MFKKLAKLFRQEVFIQTSISFLIKCKHYGLIPNFVKNSTCKTGKLFEHASVNTKTALKKSTEILHNKIINLTIKEKYRDINVLKTKITKLKQDITEHVDGWVVDEFEVHQRNSHKKANETHKTRLENKFSKLKSAAITKLGICTDPSWFVNKSNSAFPPEVQLLLSLGKKFAVPYDNREFPLLNTIADGEYALQLISDEERRGVARAQFCELISKHTRMRMLDNNKKLLLRLFDDAVKFLADKKDEIIITSADKGNMTVVMGKEDYMTKLQTLLNDRNTYKTIRQDPTLTLQNKNNNIVKQLVSQKYIDEIEKYKMTTYTAHAPRIYGLPKVHKSDFPLRPIVTTINSPSYKLSKFLGNILKHLTQDSNFNVRNSEEFVLKLKNIKGETHESMVSFDVISLFTNIPINTCTKIIESKWEILSNFTKIPKKQFMEILKFCIIECNYFLFNGKYYKQYSGLPMGSPLSPVLADIVLEDLINKTLKNLSYTPKIITKYVDDLFLILPTEEIEDTLEKFNKYHDRLKFTIEHEADGKLPYLDVMVIRENDFLITDWYCKPISSGRLLNYMSDHPRHQKINVAKNFVKKVFNLSDEKFHKKNKNIIYKVLGRNSFPKHIIKKLIWQCKRQTLNINETNIPGVTKKIYRGATYISGLSEGLQSICRKYNENIRIACGPKKTIGKLFTNTKDKVQTQNKYNVVYKIPCSGDKNNKCIQNYVGTTSQLLKNRISGHKSDLKNKNHTKTSLADHCLQKNHTPDFDKINILTMENIKEKRYVLEALHIYRTDNTVNRKTDTANINATYCALIEKEKRII